MGLDLVKGDRFPGGFQVQLHCDLLKQAKVIAIRPVVGCQGRASALNSRKHVVCCPEQHLPALVILRQDRAAGWSRGSL